MTEKSNAPFDNKPEEAAPDESSASSSEKRSPAEVLWTRIVHLGLGETALRVGTGIASLVLVALVVWVMGNFVLKNQAQPTEQSLPTASAVVA